MKKIYISYIIYFVLTDVGASIAHPYWVGSHQEMEAITDTTETPTHKILLDAREFLVNDVRTIMSTARDAMLQMLTRLATDIAQPSDSDVTFTVQVGLNLSELCNLDVHDVLCLGQNRTVFTGHLHRPLGADCPTTQGYNGYMMNIVTWQRRVFVTLIALKDVPIMPRDLSLVHQLMP